MKSLYLFILVLFTSSILNAQNFVSANIVDEQTNLPLAYVNIGIVNTSLGTVSDEKGNFRLDFTSQQDSLVFSYLGYEKQAFEIKALLLNGKVKLKPSSVMIEEISISSSNFDKEVVLGERNEKGRGKSIGFGNAQLGTELGALIGIEKETYIKSANFVLNHAKGDSLLLRINFYSYVNKTIGEKVVSHNIYVKDKQRKGTYTIDLESYEIILDSDILLTVEWLKDFDESGNKMMTFDTKKSRKMKGTFIRPSKTTDFIIMPFKKKYRPCIYLIGMQSSN